MAGEERQGPSAADINLMSQRMMAGGGGSGAPDHESIIENSSFLLSRWLKIKLSSLFDTGIFAHLKTPQSSFDKPMNQMAQSMNVRGGMVAKALVEKTQLNTARDFSKLTKPEIEGFPVAHMSYASLGNLSPPSDFGGGGQGMGMGGMSA